MIAVGQYKWSTTKGFCGPAYNLNQPLFAGGLPSSGPLMWPRFF